MTALQHSPDSGRDPINILFRMVKYGMGSRKYKAINRWKRARKGLLHKER